MVSHAFNLKADLCEFEASLVYKEAIGEPWLCSKTLVKTIETIIIVKSEVSKKYNILVKVLSNLLGRKSGSTWFKPGCAQKSSAPPSFGLHSV